MAFFSCAAFLFFAIVSSCSAVRTTALRFSPAGLDDAEVEEVAVSDEKTRSGRTRSPCKGSSESSRALGSLSSAAGAERYTGPFVGILTPLNRFASESSSVYVSIRVKIVPNFFWKGMLSTSTS